MQMCSNIESVDDLFDVQSFCKWTNLIDYDVVFDWALAPQMISMTFFSIKSSAQGHECSEWLRVWGNWEEMVDFQMGSVPKT